MTAAGIELEQVAFRIGTFSLADVSLTVRKGEYFVLTGPNGAGKTILLKLIAGLLSPLAGAIRIDGQTVTHLAPWQRGVGYVPQDGVLFPNRTVRRNIGFALEVRNVDSATANAAVQRMAELVGIASLLERKPDGLSGGERQKASLARSLAFQPAVLLLDEPVSAIDEAARDHLCSELRRIQRDTGVTTVHVAHNRRETALVADRVGVLGSDGKIRIEATP